jgi:hypothetical protein
MPTMKDFRLRPLIEKFGQLVLEQSVFVNIYRNEGSPEILERKRRSRNFHVLNIDIIWRSENDQFASGVLNPFHDFFRAGFDQYS